jgi:ubiquinone biosynthesis monooxygenase Coq7
MRNNKTSFPSKLLVEFDRFLKISSNQETNPSVSLPIFKQNNFKPSKHDLNHTKGLMRINHTGEVCAQALYYGQALLAKDIITYDHLIQAADEEHNHLCWCYERITDFETYTSILNPFWYASSFVLGATAALFGDKISYGFVIEIEKQVENHLQEHIDQIPQEDTKTHAILAQMKADEIRHGQNARDAGGVEFPDGVKSIMTAMSKVMKFLVYRL